VSPVDAGISLGPGRRIDHKTASRRQPVRRSDRDPGLPTIRPHQLTDRDGGQEHPFILHADSRAVGGGPSALRVARYGSFGTGCASISGVLVDAVQDLADHFRTYGEPDLARALDGLIQGAPDGLPRRVLAMFTHGMGGLLDRPLYSGGRVNAEATQRRDDLAHVMYEAAKAELR